MCNNQEKQSFSFEQILRHAVDRQIAGKSIDPLVVAYVREKVENSMLVIIEEHSLMDVLLCNLGLYELCKTLKQGSVKHDYGTTFR